MSQAFLPSMRQLVARALRDRGMSQSKIAALLGTTQASVSGYLSSSPEKAYASLARLSVSKEEADGFVLRLSAAVGGGGAEGVRELEAIWWDLLGSGRVCPAHVSLYPSLAGCDVCVKKYGGRGGRERTIAEVAGAVKMLEGSPEFVSVMPEVSVNLACAGDDASTPADVVAVPGRVVRVRGRARGMLPPEAGASAHMAKMLLLARSRRPELRACINLRYDGRMRLAMREAGLKALTLGGARRADADDPTVDAFERRLKAPHGRFDAVVEEGGGGIEPNVYLFATGAREAAELAIRLARAYSAGQLA
jgi:predicted fused transcriptional regulator/phosphomethylpyrimidine kinase/predicted transcriptional regulator